MQVSVKTNLPSNKAIRRELQAAPAKLQRVQVTAVRRTLKSARAHISKTLRQDLNIKKGALDRKNLKVTLTPTRSHPSARLSITGGRIPLINFDAKQGQRSKRNPNAPGGKRGVSYRIKKGGRRERVQDMFIVTFRSGHTAVVKRHGKSRYPINELFGPSVPQAAQNNPELSQAALTPVIENRLQKEVDHAAKRALKLK